VKLLQSIRRQKVQYCAWMLFIFVNSITDFIILKPNSKKYDGKTSVTELQILKKLLNILIKVIIAWNVVVNYGKTANKTERDDQSPLPLQVWFPNQRLQTIFCGHKTNLRIFVQTILVKYLKNEALKQILNFFTFLLIIKLSPLEYFISVTHFWMVNLRGPIYTGQKMNRWNKYRI